jgi:hypothetical protein
LQRNDPFRQRGDAANPTADDHADQVGVLRRDGQLGSAQRLGCGGNCQVNETVVPTDLFTVHIVVRIEAAHLACDARVQIRSITERYWTDPAPRFADPLPERRYIKPKRTDGAHSGNNDTP